MKVRKLLIGCLSLWVLAMGGCVAGLSLLAVAQPNSMVLPEPTGPFPVGRVFLDWTDEDRRDPLAPNRNTLRRLPIWIWYPAIAASDAPKVDYLPDAVLAALDDASSPILVNTIGRVVTDQRNVRPHAVHEPPAADGSFPVLLMRPLRGGLAPQYSVYAEDLASHGYVVVGADTPYTTRVAIYSDGEVVHRTAAGAPPELAAGNTSPIAPGLPNDLFLPVLEVLVDDGSFILDTLTKLNAGDGRFSGRLDLDTVGAFGHSVGGTAALQFCASERRCAAAINIDGYLMGSVTETGIGKPFMFLSSDRPIWRKSDAELNDFERAMFAARDRIREALPNDVQWIVIENSGHFSFSDAALFWPPIIGRLTGSLGSIDAEHALALTRDYIRTFFDVYLKGDNESQLSALGKDYPEALVNFGIDHSQRPEFQPGPNRQ
jgi:dienelactone hydrolase